VSEVTILSSSEDRLVGDVARLFYVDDRPPTGGRILADAYLFTSSWDTKPQGSRSGRALEEKVNGIRQQRSLPTMQFVERLDIVGHALRGEDGKVIGITMGDEPTYKFSLDTLDRGIQILARLLPYCVEEVVIRLILCDGDGLVGPFTNQVLGAIHTVRQRARLQTTTQRIGLESFGVGGFNNPSALADVTPQAPPRT
jgi:hypothetical protein